MAKEDKGRLKRILVVEWKEAKGKYEYVRINNLSDGAHPQVATDDRKTMQYGHNLNYTSTELGVAGN